MEEEMKQEMERKNKKIKEASVFYIVQIFIWYTIQLEIYSYKHYFLLELF